VGLSESIQAWGLQAALRHSKERLIREAPTLQDRLILELLDETGGRRGEIASLRIKDVQFERIGEL